ncbi:hypothetical protein J5N97_001397 [Dioscorea zingiberensis]|uniref:Isopenicillin N synthase-like Fe(2+) 2OG dioxygenase domain-containing protein n=1 Tax=Dioscorea zingiberensis TaxID=325984 RepID=A0A9D5BU42_9LILI|nr:hypothetical protein J5N97_001397 [Dioscorea zingiberensis]
MASRFPNSFNVVIGESFQAWSNGRVKATPHRVKMLNNEKRYSIQLRSQFKDGCMIQAPEELVDQDHPQLYKPYNFADYLKFLFSNGGWAENTDTLKAYWLEMRKAGTEEWVKVRGEVMEALETQGFFEAVYDDVSSETLEELFGPVLKELFGVPLDVKMIMNHSDMPYEAYAPRRPGCNF